MQKWPTVVSGFPEMWTPVYEKYKGFFEAAKKIETLHNRMMREAISGDLPIIVRHMVQVMANDYGAVLTLVLNGYGVQAMKVARSMFEAEINIHYLKEVPDGIRNFVDFYFIERKRLYDLLTPDQKKSVDPTTLAEIEADYDRVSPRFVRNKKGDLRDDWCPISLWKRAQAAGMGELYVTQYHFASSMHHSDVSGVISSYDLSVADVEAAPSYQWLQDALLAAHGSFVRGLVYFREIANVGFERELDELQAECAALFKSL